MKQIALAIIAFTFSMSTQAQECAKHSGKHEHHDKGKMMQQLNLSQTQKDQLKANHEAFKEKEKALESNDNMTLKDYKQQKASLRKEEKDKNDAILTPEQKTKLETLKKEKKEKHEQEADKRMEMMKSKIGLTDEQFAKIKTEREQTKSQIESIKNNPNISEQDKNDQICAIRKQKKEEFKNQLTPEQRKKLEEFKKEAKKDKNKGTI